MPLPIAAIALAISLSQAGSGIEVQHVPIPAPESSIASPMQLDIPLPWLSDPKFKKKYTMRPPRYWCEDTLIYAVHVTPLKHNRWTVEVELQVRESHDRRGALSVTIRQGDIKVLSVNRAPLDLEEKKGLRVKWSFVDGRPLAASGGPGSIRLSLKVEDD